MPASKAPTTPKAVPGAMARAKPCRSGRGAAAADAAVVHSSMCRRETPSRQSVRKMASSERHAASAKNAAARPVWSKASLRSSCISRRCVRRCSPVRCGTAEIAACRNDGSIKTTKASPVANTAASPGNSQPTISIVRVAGASSDRRNVSSTLIRPSALSPPFGPSHGRSCQSPRHQRCTRRAARSCRSGKASTSSTSEASPARAKMPSNRSWLSRVLSGTRPAITVSKASRS